MNYNNNERVKIIEIFSGYKKRKKMVSNFYINCINIISSL